MAICDEMLAELVALTQLHYCFLDTATMAYSISLQTVDLELQPNSTTNCAFEDEVNISILFSDEIETETYIYDSFRPTQNESIVLTQISIPDNFTVNFAYLNISSLQYFTLVRVAEFERVRSKLDRCFDETQSKMHVKLTQYELTLQLTDECYSEILLSNEYDIEFSTYAQSVEISIANGVGCRLDEEHEQRLICTADGQFSKFIQVPFIEVAVTFYIELNGNEYTLAITFDRPVLGTYSGLYEAENELTISELNAYIHAAADITLGAQLETRIYGFNKVLMRFLVKHQATGNIFEMQSEMTQFDISRSAFIFKCGFDNACIKQLKEIYSNYADYVFAFDITFFKNTEFLALVEQYLTSKTSCSSTSLVQYKKAGMYDIEFDFEQGSKCALDLTKPISVTTQIINNTAPNPILYTIQSSLQGSIATLDCKMCKQCTVANMQNQIDVLAQLTQGDIVTFILIDKTRRADYRAVMACACALGGVCVLASLIDTTGKVIVFRRVVRTMRKK